MKSPCLDCDERAFRCHGTCERYGKFHAYRESIIAGRAAVNSGDDYRSEHRERAIRKNMRYGR